MLGQRRRRWTTIAPTLGAMSRVCWVVAKSLYYVGPNIRNIAWTAILQWRLLFVFTTRSFNHAPVT